MLKSFKHEACSVVVLKYENFLGPMMSKAMLFGERFHNLEKINLPYIFNKINKYPLKSERLVAIEEK